MTIYPLGDIAQEVEGRVGDPHVPVEGDIRTGPLLIFPKEGLKYASKVTSDDLAQSSLGFHVRVETVDTEGRGGLPPELDVP